MSATNSICIGSSALIRIHKVVTRGLSISMQCSRGTGPEPDLRDGFQRFVQALYSGFVVHNDGEDEIAFPLFKMSFADGPFEVLSSQHRQMMPLLDKVNAWCNQGSTAWETASIAGLHSTLSELNSLWHKHFPIEQILFGPRECERMLTPEENAWLDEQLAVHAAQYSHPGELVLPFILYNLEGDDRAAMSSAMPQVIAEQLVPFDWKPSWAPMHPFLLD